MPNKGFYTQGFAILLDNEVPLDKIIDAISDEFKVVKRIDKSRDWAVSGPAITIEYQKEINGYISVDVVNTPWPDEMGDPQKESMIFGAWAMGHFGPFAYPGNMLRASYNCWSYRREEICTKHKAFYSNSLKYIFGSVSKMLPVFQRIYDVIIGDFLTKLKKAFNITGTFVISTLMEKFLHKKIIDSLLDRQAEIAFYRLVLANVVFNLP